MRILSGPGRSVPLTAAAVVLIGLAAGASASGRPDPGQAQSYDLSSLPAAAEYSTDAPKGHGFLGSEAAVLERSLGRINKALGTSLRADNRLSRLARWVYERPEADRSMPQQSVVDLLTHHLGLPEPLPHMFMTYAPDAPRLARVVSARLAQVFDLADYTHIGGVAEQVEAGVVVVIALSQRHVQMTPVPRSLPGPGRLSLEGTLIDGYGQPKLAHTLPNGETEMEALGKGPAFAASVDLTLTGRHRLEVVASGRSGPTVIVNFPLYVGTPAETVVEAASEARRAQEPYEAQARLFELINEERARAGLDALKLDPELCRAALSHSGDMRRNDFVGHVSPTSGETAERLLKAGIVADLAAENVGRGYSPDEIHKGLMDSPGHRAAILHSSVTHVGIGVSSDKNGNLTDYLVTEIFIRRIPPLGPDAVGRVLAELAARPEREGLQALEEDPSLSKLAGEAAREFLEDPVLSQSDVMGRLRQQLGQSQAVRGSATAAFIIAGSLKEGVERIDIDPKTWSHARRVGVGIAQGARPGLVPNSIFLILIFTE